MTDLWEASVACATRDGLAGSAERVQGPDSVVYCGKPPSLSSEQCYAEGLATHRCGSLSKQHPKWQKYAGYLRRLRRQH